MKKSSKIFIVLALMCISVAAAYSQDCNSYLKQATEMRDKGDYCQAKQYYQMYQSCNADADVSTEIAMCVNRIKIQNPGTDCPDYVPANGKSQASGRATMRTSSGNTSSGYTSSGNRAVKPVASVGNQMSSAPAAQFKIGLDIGAQLPMGDFGKIYKMGFGGELNAKYMINENIGVGLGAGYYTFGAKDELLNALIDEYGADKMNDNFSIIPVVGKFSYYFGQNAFKPYLGVDVGLYMLRESISGEVDGESDSSSDSSSKFGFAPVLGFEYTLTKNLGLDVNVKYNYILTDIKATTTVGISAGIVYLF